MLPRPLNRMTQRELADYMREADAKLAQTARQQAQATAQARQRALAALGVASAPTLTLADLRHLTAAEINAHWDAITPVLQASGGQR